MNIYEQFGRLTEQYETEYAAHLETIGVLRALKSGTLSLDAVTVTDDNRWAIASDEPAVEATEATEVQEELPCPDSDS